MIDTNRLAIPPGMVFLVDGAGALVTAILTGIVLRALNEHIGMPLEWLKALAAIATCMALFSFCCHNMLRPVRRPLFLAIIMCTNLFYCILTAILALVHKADLSALGLAYFVGEIMVILLLVSLEYRTYRAMANEMSSGSSTRYPE